MVTKRSAKPPGIVALRILAFLRAHNSGHDINELERAILKPGEDQSQFDRRLRELDPFHIIERRRVGKRTLYFYQSERPEGQWEYGEVDKKTRATVLHNAGGRCQMCGRTVAEDSIKLHVDHKIPQNWGGASNDIGNLWAICSSCNEGKKAYFATYDAETMKEVLAHKSVHKRILELLRLAKGKPVDTDIIQFVANFGSNQDDWQKRLREIRYTGIVIESTRRKVGRRSVAYYSLVKDLVNIPDDLTSFARQYERDRATAKK